MSPKSVREAVRDDLGAVIISLSVKKYISCNSLIYKEISTLKYWMFLSGKIGIPSESVRWVGVMVFGGPPKYIFRGFFDIYHIFLFFFIFFNFKFS